MQGRIRGFLGAAAALCLATTAWAGAGEDRSLCDYRLDYSVRLDGEAVSLERSGTHWRLVGDRLYRNDREQPLSAAQRDALSEYRAELQRLVPVASRLAIDGAMLGLESLSLVAHGLGNEAAAARLERRMTRAATELHRSFDGRHLPAGQPLSESLDPVLEDEIEGLAAEAAWGMTRSVFSFLVDAITDPDGAEARGEQLERLAERRIEPRAEALERRADALCADLRRLDALETRLGTFDLLQPEPDHGRSAGLAAPRRG